MKLLPSRRVLCTPYNHAPYHFMQSHKHKVHACLAVTCLLHFWQNDRDLLRATGVTVSAQKVDPGEENSAAAPAGIRTRDLTLTTQSGALTTEPSLIPKRPLNVSCFGARCPKSISIIPIKCVDFNCELQILLAANNDVSIHSLRRDGVTWALVCGVPGEIVKSMGE